MSPPYVRERNKTNESPGKTHKLDVKHKFIMAEITGTACMRCTQMSEIPAARRRGDKERNAGKQLETEQAITITVFYRLASRRPWLSYRPPQKAPIIISPAKQPESPCRGGPGPAPSQHLDCRAFVRPSHNGRESDKISSPVISTATSMASQMAVHEGTKPNRTPGSN